MKYCPNCGEEIDEDQSYCQNCGKDLETNEKHEKADTKGKLVEISKTQKKKLTKASFGFIIVVGILALAATTLNGQNETPQNAVSLESHTWKNIDYTYAEGGGTVSAAIRASSENSEEVEVDVWSGGSSQSLTISPGNTREIEFQADSNSDINLRYRYEGSESKEKEVALGEIPTTPITASMNLEEVTLERDDDWTSSKDDIETQIEVTNNGQKRINIPVVGSQAGISVGDRVDYWNDGWEGSYYSAQSFVPETNELTINPGDTKTMPIDMQITELVDSPPAETDIEIPVGIYHGEITEVGTQITVRNR
jgi:hypothetical protein